MAFKLSWTVPLTFLIILTIINVAHSQQSGRIRKLYTFFEEDLEEETADNVDSFYPSGEVPHKKRKLDLSAKTENGKRTDELQRSVEFHTRRFLNLFLRFSSFQHKLLIGLEENDVVDANINLRISVKLLSRLREISEDENSTIPLHELDTIFTEMLQLSSWDSIKDYMAPINPSDYIYGIFISCNPFTYIIAVLHILNPAPYFVALFEIISSSPIFQLSSIQFAILFTIITASVVWYLEGAKKAILCAVIALSMVEALQSYDNKLKTVEIKAYLRERENMYSPPECDPRTRSVTTTIFNWFREDPCIQFYREQTSQPRDHVSFLDCFLDSFIASLISKPLEGIGKGVALMAAAISGRSAYGWVIYPIVAVCCLIAVGIAILVYNGQGVRISSWFGSFSLNHGNRTEAPAQARPAINQNPEPIQINVNFIMPGESDNTLRRRISVSSSLENQEASGSTQERITTANIQATLPAVAESDCGQVLKLDPTASSHCTNCKKDPKSSSGSDKTDKICKSSEAVEKEKSDSSTTLSSSRSTILSEAVPGTGQSDTDIYTDFVEIDEEDCRSEDHSSDELGKTSTGDSSHDEEGCDCDTESLPGGSRIVKKIETLRSKLKTFKSENEPTNPSKLD